MSVSDQSRRLEVVEPAHTPPLSLLLAFSAMIPLVVGAVCAWMLRDPSGGLAEDAAVLWGGAVLTFLAGVRRGLSFRTEGGPRVAQIATMLWLFLLGVGALATLSQRISPLLLLVGYVSLAILDPLAARRGEAPLFFERLRPVQMLIPIVAVVAIIVLDGIRAGIVR